MKAIYREPKKIVPLFIAALFFLTLLLNISPNYGKVVLYPLYREIKKKCVMIESSDFSKIETNNFIIFYKDTDKKFVNMIKKDAEHSIERVLRDFNYDIEHKICMIIYGNYDEMAKSTGLDSGYAAMGVYYGGVISILDPSKWIKDNKSMRDIFEIEGPIVHELTHYIIDYLTGGNVSVWFTEGLALYEEYIINGIEWADNRTYTHYYDIRTLEERFYDLDEIKAYKQSFLAVKYIGENFGMKAINEIIMKLKEGKTMEQAINNVLGMGIQDVFDIACRAE